MEKEVQSSFIPKKVLSKEPATRRHEPIGLFLLLSVVVLLVALIFAGGTFYWRTHLQTNLEQVAEDLETRRQSLAPQSFMEKIERLDKQLRQALAMLEGHRNIRPAFEFLQSKTLQSIRYQSFDHSGTTLSLSGSARNYEGIALQSDVLADDRRVVDFVFSNLNVTSEDRVSFNLEVELSPELFSDQAYLSSVAP